MSAREIELEERPDAFFDAARPEAIQAMIAKSFESRLPKAIHDATGELVERLVEARVHQQLAPMMHGLVGNQLEKAGATAQLDQRTAGAKGLLYDPFTALDQMGFRERPSALTYRALAEMARRTPPFAAYLQTRLNQIAAFAEPQPDEHSIGFKIRLADRRAKMTPGLQQRADDIAQLVMTCGDKKIRTKRDKFGKYLRKFAWDSLVYDQATSEIVPYAGGNFEPSYWRVLDGATMRIADQIDELDLDDDSIQYVQIYENTVVAEFTDEELIFGVRNPRSDLRSSGYGQSELEMLITIVTALLWGIDYNAKFFSQGSVAKGILNFKGAVPEAEMVNFRRQWYAMITGVANAWRTPVVNAEDVQWLDMQSSNRDMEFSNWIDWLLKVTCAVVQIAPEEIGFQFGNSGQSSTMNEGGQADKIAASKDKGLVPLAKFIAEDFNDKILSKIDDRFVLEFAGVGSRTAEALIDLQTKEVKALKTVDEIRQDRGLKPLPNGTGAVILDPTFLAFAQAKMAGGAQGPPNAPLDGGPIHQPPQQGQGGNPDDTDDDDDDGPGGNPDDDTDSDDGDNFARSEGLATNQAAALKASVIDFEVDL